jgi:SAM-dependent methyltransferase
MLKLRPIHPFPARMAPSIVWNKLPKCKPRMRVLDPMAGSGTTLVAARVRGHEAIGFDRDPLAVLIAGAWAADVDQDAIELKAKQVLKRAGDRERDLTRHDSFPSSADEETKEFLQFWFDDTNRRQLTALSDTISRLHDPVIKSLLWCAFSRLIITKKVGVSLATDVSHSRPHRTYDQAPVNTFDQFPRAVKAVLNAAPFKRPKTDAPAAQVSHGDARMMSLKDESVDIVITSPPYLNAIDYLRGHKLSLVWMGYTVDQLREIRSTNVGAEVSNVQLMEEEVISLALERMCEVEGVSERHTGMLCQYVKDIDAIIREIKRVLVEQGDAVFVVGNSTLLGNFIKNSECIKFLAERVGFTMKSSRRRALPENRRYLPPPTSKLSGDQLQSRMREEVILTFTKT